MDRPDECCEIYKVALELEKIYPTLGEAAGKLRKMGYAVHNHPISLKCSLSLCYGPDGHET
jgi:hypothetical protein